MGRRRDGTLAVIALAAFLLAFVAVEATLSTPFFLLGVLGTVVFEALATRAYDRIRACWERPPVQVTTLASAFVIATAGTVVAPSSVLSAGIGAVVAYLVLLGLVTWRDVH